MERNAAINLYTSLYCLAYFLRIIDISVFPLNYAVLFFYPLFGSSTFGAVFILVATTVAFIWMSEFRTLLSGTFSNTFCNASRHAFIQFGATTKALIVISAMYTLSLSCIVFPFFDTIILLFGLVRT